MSILQANAAPPQKSQGWASVGQALAGLSGAGREQAYDRGMARAAELDNKIQTARFNREKAMEAEKKRTERTGFVSRAVAAGIPEERAALLANAFESGYDPTKITAFQGGMQEQGFRDNIVAQALAGDMPAAGAYSMGLAKGPLEMTKIVDGTGYNPYLQADQEYHTTPVGQSTIGQRNASAAASYASANNSNASAARERQAMTLDRADTMGGSGGRSGMKAPSGYRWGAGGGLEFIPGGPADPSQKAAGVATEGERKAATLLARLEGSLGQMNTAIAEDKSAARPGVLAALAGNIPFSGETARNLVNSSERQRVEAAQLDILDAALTLGTGAAYTKEQLEGYRKSFFPQLGDAGDTVKDKQARLDNVVDSARIAAGRAAPTSATGSATQAFGGPAPQPQRARNPATGQVLVLRNGQWVPE
ncbi:hypothetical protein [Stenotrophomonas bentonitica]|uniref:hypothetical protein n=1 Tax=Stenotrophomonas bentonitica TaxID=1450134 RepID=UPI0031BB7DE1